MKDIKLYEIHSEIGAGTRGSSLGQDALRIAALNAGSNYFKDHQSLDIEDENLLLYEPTETLHALRIEGVAKVYERMATTISQALQENDHFPIILASDHASAGGTLAGVRKAFPEKRIGVVWVDAHADLHSPYTSPSGNVHGMPLASALGEDNMECRKNMIDETTKGYWEQLKNASGVQPCIQSTDLVFVAVRDTEAEENHLMNKYNIPNFTVEDLREQGAIAIAESVLERLSHCDLIYVSFDVDSLDCDAVSLGTGTPVPNGLFIEEAKLLLDHLVGSEKICCLEVVEINPTLDNKGNAMAEAAFEILEKVSRTIEMQ